MDTRRLSEPMSAAQPRAAAPVGAHEAETGVEVVELTAVRPSRSVLPRVAFVVAILVLSGLIAWAGFPSRTSLAFDTPLPNLLAGTPAP